MSSGEAIALLSKGMSFNHDVLFALSDDEIDTLLGAGRLNLRPEHLEPGVWEENREIADGALCLALRESWSDRPPSSARKYTTFPEGWKVDNADIGGLDDPEGHSRNMWLARLEADGPALSLLDRRSVSELLGEIVGLSAAQARSSDDWLKNIEPNVLPEALAEASANGTWSGTWTICACGQWDDGATFLWMRNHRLLMRVITDSGSPWRIQLLPSS